MSTKQKRKPRARPAKKEQPKTPKKRRPPEERKKEIPGAPETRPEKKIAEPIKERPFFLAVRLLGPFGAPKDIKHALNSLRLRSRFTAVLVENNDSTLGMLRRVKDYVTWGDVGSSSISALLKERGYIGSAHLDNKLAKEKLGFETVEQLAQAITRGQVSLKTLRNQGVEPTFSLHPPSGGFELSIKRPLGGHGELGYRGDQIVQLISRMM